MSGEGYIRSELEERILEVERAIELIEDKLSFNEEQVATNLTLSEAQKIRYRVECMQLEEELKSKKAQRNELVMLKPITKQ